MQRAPGLAPTELGQRSPTPTVHPYLARKNVSDFGVCGEGFAGMPDPKNHKFHCKRLALPPADQIRHPRNSTVLPTNLPHSAPLYAICGGRIFQPGPFQLPHQPFGWGHTEVILCCEKSSWHFKLKYRSQPPARSSHSAGRRGGRGPPGQQTLNFQKLSRGNPRWGSKIRK